MLCRLLELGLVSAVRSQAVYHAVAECADAHDAPSLCLLRPDRPYVSIGYHQDADRELDLTFCRQQGLPVVRRRVGGGAVLLDGDQIFFHLVVPRARSAELRLPLRLSERYGRLTAPVVAAYHRLGVPAEFRPISDIQVDGRKIGGTGTADIGESFVFVGSMMLAFDHALMARVLRLSEDRLREAVRKSIAEQVTSLDRIIGKKPSIETVRTALVAGFQQKLGLELQPGRLSACEEARTEELQRLFSSEQWLRRIAWDDARPRKLTISSGVNYIEGETPGGRVRMAARVVDGRIDALLLGDNVPSHTAAALRHEFLGLTLTTMDLDERFARIARAAQGTAEKGEIGEVAALARKLVETAAQEHQGRRDA